MSEEKPRYKSTFFIVPARILELPDLTLSYLKIFETIYQFWNHGKVCFLSNQMIMQRTGIDSDSTVRAALRYFETHNELKRENEDDGRRYLSQPALRIETDKTEAVDNYEGGGDLAPGGRRFSTSPPGAKSPHKINNIKIKKLNKSFCPKTSKAVDKSNGWPERLKSSPLAGVTTQSTSYKPSKKVKVHKEAMKAAMEKLPRSLRPKKYRTVEA